MGENTIIKRDFDPKSLIVPLIILLVLLGVVWGIYNYYNNRSDVVDPTIEITTPVDGETYDSEKITVQGKANTNNLDLTVTGESVDVAKDGSFSTEVPLREGENLIGIVAKGSSGKTAERNITVFKRIEPPVANDVPSTGADLSQTGPESFWIPEITLLSAAGASYYGSRKKLKQTIQKNS
jgi:hypothetical protein